MTREKQIDRRCNQCKFDKRTTVYPSERAVYFCEDCETKAGRIALMNPLADDTEKPSIIKGALIGLVVFLAGLAFGKWLF